MSDKILVAYTTAAGSTTGVAEAIGKALGSDGTAIDVHAAKEVKDLSGYSAVVVGSGIRAGNVYKDTLAFLEQHQATLSQMPVAYFVVCMTMSNDTEENRTQVAAYVDQMREKAPQVEPVGVGLFAGKMDYKVLSLPLRLIMKAMKSEEGDYRNWETISEWAEGIRPALMGQ